MKTNIWLYRLFNFLTPITKLAVIKVLICADWIKNWVLDKQFNSHRSLRLSAKHYCAGYCCILIINSDSASDRMHVQNKKYVNFSLNW